MSQVSIWFKLEVDKRNYKKWSALMIDHLREHKEVFPFLCSKELPYYTDLTPIHISVSLIFSSISMDCFVVLRKVSEPYDLWMSLWKAYGYPQVPPFLEDILPPVTPVMVPTTLVEIIPLDALVVCTDPVPAIDAPNSV